MENIIFQKDCRTQDQDLLHSSYEYIEIEQEMIKLSKLITDLNELIEIQDTPLHQVSTIIDMIKINVEKSHESLEDAQQISTTSTKTKTYIAMTIGLVLLGLKIIF